jgi:hypothetical protein
MKQLRQHGQDESCNFLEDRYGPNGVYPWKMQYNFSNCLGMIVEQQQIEGYYGLVKPNTKLGRTGALKTDVGFKYLTQEGFSSLLEFDAKRIQERFQIGNFSAQTLAAIKNGSPEYLILSLLMDSNQDTKTISILGNNNIAQRQFLGCSGYICNGPKFIGSQITNSDIQNYIMENTVEFPATSWNDGFKQYVNRTQRFCLVRPMDEYADSSTEARLQVEHMLCLPTKWFCNCPLYWSRLHCPASVFINNQMGLLDP